MGIADEEKFVVALVESAGRKLDSVQVWGPFDDHAAAKKWVESNAIIHIDPFGLKSGSRVFRIAPLVSELYP